MIMFTIHSGNQPLVPGQITFLCHIVHAASLWALDSLYSSAARVTFFKSFFPFLKRSFQSVAT
jgi:hypothetical protein